MKRLSITRIKYEIDLNSVDGQERQGGGVRMGMGGFVFFLNQSDRIEFILYVMEIRETWCYDNWSS